MFSLALVAQYDVLFLHLGALAENVSSVLSMSVYGFFISGLGALVFFIGLGLWASVKSK